MLVGTADSGHRAITIAQWNTASFGPDYRLAPLQAVSETLGWTLPQDLPAGPMIVALSWLYSKVDSDDPNAGSETLSMTMNYLAARNVRLFAEGGGDLEADTGRVSIGLITAF